MSDFEIPAVPIRPGVNIPAGYPISLTNTFKRGETFTIQVSMPETPCFRGCGRDLRGQTVALVDPHTTDKGEHAWHLACVPGEGCGK